MKNEDLYYKIDCGTLYLSSDPDGKFTVSTRTDDDILYWPWTDNEDLTKVVIENVIAPSTCCRMFAGLWHIAEVEGLENLDTSHVTNMCGMFDECSDLKSLDVSSFDTSSVTDMSYMFSDCYNIDGLDLSSFDTGNVTDMSYMFRNCNALEALDLSTFDIGKAQCLRCMFQDCPMLTFINLSGWDTSNLPSVSIAIDMLRNCRPVGTIVTSDEAIVETLRWQHPHIEVAKPETSQAHDAAPSIADALSQLAVTAAALQEGISTLQKAIDSQMR